MGPHPHRTGTAPGPTTWPQQKTYTTRTLRSSLSGKIYHPSIILVQLARSPYQSPVNFLISLLIIILEATGTYCDGDFSPGCGYLWVQIIYNISYTIALYALLVFYLGAHDALEPYSPLLKFVLVKVRGPDGGPRARIRARRPRRGALVCVR